MVPGTLRYRGQFGQFTSKLYVNDDIRLQVEDKPIMGAILAVCNKWPREVSISRLIRAIYLKTVRISRAIEVNTEVH